MSLRTLIFLVLIVGVIYANESECDPKYLKITSMHTMCQDPNPVCQINRRGVSNEDKEVILELHNEIRSKVATGKDGLPEAADMLEMVWDEELAQLAQKHVETCVYAHDCNACRSLEHFQVGQNLGKRYSIGNFYRKENDWKGFINSLYNEKDSFGRYENLINYYVGGPKDQQNQYGHYSQIIWSDSWRIGCGWVYFRSGLGNTSYFGCNYGPAGNVLKRNVYKEGHPCSSCPRNTCCGKTCADFNISSQYEGLCKIIEETLPPAGIGKRNSEVLFICDNYGQADCDYEFRGITDWKLVKSINGNWISIELEDGQSSRIVMKTPFRNSSPHFCYKIKLRSSAVTEGLPYGFAGSFTFIANSGQILKGSFQSPGNRQKFVPFYMNISMPEDAEIMTVLSFAVGPGAPPQFIDIKEISATRGKCQKNP